MPLRLTVGVARKISDDNYGSRGASVNLEVELDSSLAAEPAKLQERIRHLFGLVRQSLGEELNGQAQPAHGSAQQSMAPGPSANGAKQTNGKQFATARLATPAQVKALYAITKQLNVDLYAALRARYDVERPEELSLKQASAFIDSLKSDNAAPAA